MTLFGVGYRQGVGNGGSRGGREDGDDNGTDWEDGDGGFGASSRGDGGGGWRRILPAAELEASLWSTFRL